jgi:hypothetical protein
MTIQDQIKEYELLKIQSKALDAKMKELNDGIKDYMVENEIDNTSVLPEGGKIELRYKSTWKYPEEVEDLKEKYDSEKKRAEMDGTAKEIKNPFIQYTAAKA